VLGSLRSGVPGIGIYSRFVHVDICQDPATWNG